MIRLGTPADLAAADTVYRRASLANAGDRENLLAHPEYLILGPEGLAEGRTHVAEEDGSVVGFATWAEIAGIVEDQLRRLFPWDEIAAVKTGQRGADVIQVVKTPLGVTAGTILWETKNAQWQPSWHAKLRADMREAGADHAVLISANMPDAMEAVTYLDGTEWAARPAAVGALATMLRQSVLHAHDVTRLHESSDEKVRVLLAYVTGPDFRHRLDNMLDAFNALQHEQEHQKRVMTQSWAKQEKAVRCLTDTVMGLSGDFAGLAGLPPVDDDGDDSGSWLAVLPVR